MESHERAKGMAGGLGAVKKVNWKTFAADLAAVWNTGFRVLLPARARFWSRPARQARLQPVRDGYWV